VNAFEMIALVPLLPLLAAFLIVALHLAGPVRGAAKRAGEGP
jgi:hypothetical protein